jgi:hypothetical protein
MRNEQYDVESAPSLTTFEFVSEGKKGKIRKIIQYLEYKESGIFNLGFGDKIGETDEFDDKAVTNNGDIDKVLATVASTIPRFFDQYPKAAIFATGSSPSRTRLYRISISNVLDEINKNFNVEGLIDENWETFKPNQDYLGFLITKK